jgi:hypothetical protein
MTDAVTCDGWAGGWGTATCDGWPAALESWTCDGWFPLQTSQHKKRGRRPRPSYAEIPRGPPVTAPNVPELTYNPPLGQSPHLARDISAQIAAQDREREIAVAKERRRKQNQRALELLLMDD